MNRALHFVVAVLLAQAPVVFAAKEKADAPPDAPAETPVAEAPVKTEAPATNAPAPALVGLVLGAGTGALILSGVDWSDDDNEPLQNIPGAPAQQAPEDGAALTGPLLTFAWKAVDGAASYLLDLDTCDDTATCADFRLDRTADLSVAIEWPPAFTAGRWRVRSIDADNRAGPWSPFRTFTVTP